MSQPMQTDKIGFFFVVVDLRSPFCGLLTEDTINTIVDNNLVEVVDTEHYTHGLAILWEQLQ